MTKDSQVARVIRTVEHSHDANLKRVEATKIIASMKESAGTRRTKPAQLYADHTQYATAHIRAEIGHQDAVKRTIHDSGPESASRILVFASQSARTHLASADKWYMDGTFDVAPLLFQQLYVIRAPLGESAVSCVYAFLPNKLQTTYEEFLTAVISKCNGL